MLCKHFFYERPVSTYIQQLHFQKHTCHCILLSEVGCSSTGGAWEHWQDQCWRPMNDGAISRPFPLLLPLGQGNPWMPWTMNKSARSPVLPNPHSSTTISLLPMPSLPASLSHSQRQWILLFSFSITAHSLCMSQLSSLSHASLSSDSFRSINLLLHRLTSSMLYPTSVSQPHQPGHCFPGSEMGQ